MNNVLSIDIGSTRTHAAAVDVDTLSCSNRIDFYNTEFDYRFIPALENIVSMSDGIRKVNITSCVKDLAIRAEEFCVNTGLFDEVNIVKAHDKLPISIRYDRPQTLGTDRLCSALACAALFKGKTCIIIDAGTAITVDRITNGSTLECGMILPGINMQFESLNKGTDALPLVGTYKETTPPLPSTSTEECIKAGVLYGTAGAVAACVSRLLGIDDNTVIITTGGDGDMIEQLFNHSIRQLFNYSIITIPNLTLIGTAVYSGLGK